MELQSLLKANSARFEAVLPRSIQWGSHVVLDMNSEYWHDVASCSLQELINKVARLLQDNEVSLAIGQYAEDRRLLYQRSDLFYDSRTLRSVHLGMDLTVEQTLPVMAPLGGYVHSFANNNYPGDYGPTIILQHELQGQIFYTLYGHLSPNSLNNCQPGMWVDQGKHFADLGAPEDNGQWPIHLHFQIIQDLKGWHGGYPGVVELQRASEELLNCPNPNLILQIHHQAN